MPTITSTYLLPAILLNPAFVLHLINTFASHIMPPPPSISHSPHPFMESIGPIRNAAPYLDMHADEQLCWSYTAVMVLVQILAFGQVNDNRVRRKSAKAAKLERERIRKEKLDKREEDRKALGSKVNGHAQSSLDSTCDAHVEENISSPGANGRVVKVEDNADDRRKESDSDESLTETSEEETIH